jgi:F-type H+-transporting ATPase subunit b
MAATPHAPTVEHAAEGAGVPHGADAAANGGEHAAAFPPFDASTFASQLVWFAITFVVLYIILSGFVLPRIAKVLAARAGTIKDDLDQAAQKGAEADDARAAMEKAVARARADARAMIDKARAKVQSALNAEQEAAEKRLADRIAAAEARVDAARQKALSEVPAIAEALAREIADKIAPAPAPAPAPRQRVAGEA